MSKSPLEQAADQIARLERRMAELEREVSDIRRPAELRGRDGFTRVMYLHRDMNEVRVPLRQHLAWDNNPPARFEQSYRTFRRAPYLQPERPGLVVYEEI